jgi:hypothetical protein
VVESYRAQVGSVLEVLAEGLAPFVDRQMSEYFEGADWIVTAATRMGRPEPVLATATDPQFQLEVMIRWWGPVFAKVLPKSTRDVVHELRQARNEWAHIHRLRVRVLRARERRGAAPRGRLAARRRGHRARTAASVRPRARVSR